jgi:hypothetical protein
LVPARQKNTDVLIDHTKWNFLNEKHTIKKDALPRKERANPLTGYINFTPVIGDFQLVTLVSLSYISE